MHILSVLSLSIASNLDNFAIGLVYGTRKIRIPFMSNLIIALFSGLGTILSCFVGDVLREMFGGMMCNIVGGLLVIGIGLWTIFISMKGEAQRPVEESHLSIKTIIDEPQIADVDHSGHISTKESLLVGVALAVNCLATGLGAGMTGLGVVVTTIAVTALSLLCVSLGVWSGRKYAINVPGCLIPVLAGGLLMVVGMFEMFK